MSVVRYNLTARNAGAPAPGLSPTWNTLVQSSGGAAVASPNTAVPITALAGGGYQVAYDPAAGELYGIVDFGSAISDPNERYADISLVAVPALPGDFLSAPEQAALSAAAGNTPAALVAAMNADPLYSQMVHHLLNKFTFNPATHALQELLDNGQPLAAALAVTADSGGNITSRQ